MGKGTYAGGMTSSPPASHRALVLDRYDGVDALVVAERPTPRPGPGEVVVEVRAAPVNPSDLAFCQGLYGIKKPLPTVPGFECSGVVVDGPQEWLGKRVACLAPETADGTWAERVLARTSQCYALDDDVSFEQGSMIIVNPLTAWAFVRLAEEHGHPALVHTAAASALGRWLIPMARQRGVKVIHVVRRKEQVTLLRELGEEHVLDQTDPGFDAALRAACKTLGARLAFDAVSGSLLMRVLSALPAQSTLYSYGALSGEPVMALPGDLIFKGKRLLGFWLSGMSDLDEGARSAQRLLHDGRTTAVYKTVPLDELAAAAKEYEADMTRGKVLVTPTR